MNYPPLSEGELTIGRAVVFLGIDALALGMILGVIVAGLWR